MTQLDARFVIDVRTHIAVLRGLYGDIAESLQDPDACEDLWVQVADEQGQLDALIQRVDAPV